MADRNYGWTMEMQIKALRHHLSISEIPVRYRERFAGVSKVTSLFTLHENRFHPRWIFLHVNDPQGESHPHHREYLLRRYHPVPV